MTERNPRDELSTSSRTAAVAEVVFLGGEGTLFVYPITPLVLDGSPAFTLPFSRANLAEELRKSPETRLVFADSRIARVGWKPLSARVRLETTVDIEGEIFREELLTDELVKRPPDRRLLDSMMLRRENWWYMPRFVFRAAEAENIHAVEKKTDPNHATLAWSDDGVSADTVSVEGWESEGILVRSLAGRSLPESEAAALFHHDFTVPDMERSATFTATGSIRNGRLAVESREGSREIANPPGLVKRWRNFRDLRKRCVAGIEEYERS